MYLLVFAQRHFAETPAAGWWKCPGPGEVWQIDDRDAAVLHRRDALPAWSEFWEPDDRSEWLIHGARREGGAGPPDKRLFRQPADLAGVVRRVTDLAQRYHWTRVRWDDYFGFDSAALVTADDALAKRAFHQIAVGTDTSWETCLAETRAGRITDADVLVYEIEPGVAPPFRAVAFLEQVDEPGKKVLEETLTGDAMPLAMYWMAEEIDDTLVDMTWNEIPYDRVRGPFRPDPMSHETFGLYSPRGRGAAEQMCSHKHRTSPRELAIFSPEADPEGIGQYYERGFADDRLHGGEKHRLYSGWQELRWAMRFLETADWVYVLNSGCAPDIGASLLCARDPALVARVADRLHGEDWRSEHLFALY